LGKIINRIQIFNCGCGDVQRVDESNTGVLKEFETVGSEFQFALA